MSQTHTDIRDSVLLEILFGYCAMGLPYWHTNNTSLCPALHKERVTYKLPILGTDKRTWRYRYPIGFRDFTRFVKSMCEQLRHRSEERHIEPNGRRNPTPSCVDAYEEHVSDPVHDNTMQGIGYASRISWKPYVLRLSKYAYPGMSLRLLLCHYPVSEWDPRPSHGVRQRRWCGTDQGTVVSSLTPGLRSLPAVFYL